MVHLFVRKSRNWQGCERLRHSPFLFWYNHFFLKTGTDIRKCAAIRFISSSVKVGVMRRQQLAHCKQSVSAHTAGSNCSADKSKFDGGWLCNFSKNPCI